MKTKSPKPTLSFHPRATDMRRLFGIGKSIVFGALIALAGCLRGMKSGRDAAAVGQAATSSVVLAITWIIATDGIFAVICNAVGI